MGALDIFLETFDNPAMVHAVTVHAPISLAFLGIPLVVLSAILKDKGASIRWLAIAAYVGLTIAAFITVKTGEDARSALPNEAGIIDQAVWDLVHDHEEMAEKVWIFALVTTILTAFTFGKGPRLRVGGGILAVLAALATAGWIALTGHYGGHLVYEHGLGTPALDYKARLMERETASQTTTPAPSPPPAEEAPAAPTPVEPPTVTTETTPPVVDPAAAPTPGPAPPESAPMADQPAPAAPEPEPAADPEPIREVSYAREVVPILQEKCYGCHGKSGGLNLETIDAMLVGGKKAGPAVLAGQPEKSPLIRYLTGELQPRMPMGGDPLPEEQVSILHGWVAQGMKDDSPE